MQHIYETDRLYLKILKPEDSKQVLDYYIRNKEFLIPWEPERNDNFYTEETQRALLELEYKKMMEGNSFRLWIFKKEDYRNRVIGNFGFSNIIRGGFQSCFLGYKLDKDEVKKGYMKEALQEGIRIAFDALHLHRIEANIMPKNKASRGLIKSLGFEEEGLAKKYLMINGLWEDHIHYSIINPKLKV